MCAIAGFFGEGVDEGGREDRLRSVEILQRMIGALRHRGPDGVGLHTEAKLGLSHARLAIIDLAGGRQPLCNEDETVWITFNGEVFNHVELRSELEARGHVFRTRSDTEVVVHAYEEDGSRCVERLNGDFAFALWDRRRRTLLLARDRAGVRPLFYTSTGNALVFASEIKSLLCYPGVRATADPVGLQQCFTLWFPIAPRTPYTGIFELPPGHVLEATSSSLSLNRLSLNRLLKRYWQLRFPEAASPRRGADAATEAALTEELHALLADATRLRLRADVPVGAYLSGGLDSSIVTALARATPGTSVCTFSVAFDSPEFDESDFQVKAIESLGTSHSSIACSSRDIAERLPEVVRYMERPVLRTAPVPLYLLSRLVRESGFKAVLTGEGADEALAGYDLFKEAKIRRFWALQPDSRWRARLLERLYPYLPGVQSQPRPYLDAFFRTGLDRTGDPLFSHLPRFRATERLRTFLSADFRHALDGYDPLEDLRSGLPREFAGWHPLSQAQYLEACYLLPGYILSSQGDRVAMAHAVEGRFPFLDHRLVEFCARIPPRLKMRGLREKHILRSVAARHLPAEICERPKQPYRAPESPCFFGPRAPDYAGELLSRRAVEESGYFDADKVERLVRKCSRASADHIPGGAPLGVADHMALVGILSTQLLHHQYFAGAHVPAKTDRQFIGA